MDNAIINVQKFLKDNKEKYAAERLRLQKETRDRRLLEQRVKESQLANKLIKCYIVQCAHCRQDITTFEDMRKIANMHYVAFNQDIVEKVEINETAVLKHKGLDMNIYKGHLVCKNPECGREIGGVMTYHKMQFPTLKFKSVTIIDAESKKPLFKAKKWSDVSFIREFGEDDLELLANSEPLHFF